jgi:hypothetical protein
MTKRLKAKLKRMEAHALGWMPRDVSDWDDEDLEAMPAKIAAEVERRRLDDEAFAAFDQKLDQEIAEEDDQP